MANNITFSMIKPDSVQDQHIGEIITMIEQAGFGIKAIKVAQLTPERAGVFYAEHKERPFYTRLCQDISAGPVIAMALEKEHAVVDFRTLIGATNPEEAAAGTIRKKFGKSLDSNAVHGSDANESAARELAFFFSEMSL